MLDEAELPFAMEDDTAEKEVKKAISLTKAAEDKRPTDGLVLSASCKKGKFQRAIKLMWWQAQSKKGLI